MSTTSLNAISSKARLFAGAGVAAFALAAAPAYAQVDETPPAVDCVDINENGVCDSAEGYVVESAVDEQVIESAVDERAIVVTGTRIRRP